MSPEKRLAKAFELSDLTRDLFERGLRRRFPGLSEDAFHALVLERLERCHNRNF